MAVVTFTQNIQRHVACPQSRVEGRTVGDVLDAYFAANERARGYVLDEQGAVRKHIAIFVNGTLIRDRITLSDPVLEGGTVCVMQALSGG